MSHKTEEIFSLTAHCCIGPNRNTTHVGMSSNNATNNIYLSKSIVVDSFGLEANIVGIMRDGGGNL